MKCIVETKPPQPAPYLLYYVSSPRSRACPGPGSGFTYNDEATHHACPCTWFCWIRIWAGHVFSSPWSGSGSGSGSRLVMHHIIRMGRVRFYGAGWAYMDSDQESLQLLPVLQLMLLLHVRQLSAALCWDSQSYPGRRWPATCPAGSTPRI